MIIIPELETVLLQPPRTGTSSVKDAVLEKYPKAFVLYRHMERVGIPHGYERYQIVSHMRNPFTRMESLFKYMSKPDVREDTDPEWLSAVQKATRTGFKDWLLNSQYVFAKGAPTVSKPYRPKYQVAYAVREQEKSQRLWAEGADDVIKFETLGYDVGRLLNIHSLPLRGATSEKQFEWDKDMFDHMWQWHEWDLNAYGYSSRWRV